MMFLYIELKKWFGKTAWIRTKVDFYFDKVGEGWKENKQAFKHL